MGDRRQGDRRDKEKGIIRIPLKRAIAYLIIAAIIIILSSICIIKCVENKKLKEELAIWESDELYYDTETDLFVEDETDIEE